MKYSHNLSLLRHNLGFTLIEMVVSLAILMVLGTASFVGFDTYNKTAKLNSAQADVRNTLNEAKSYALSQSITSSTCNQSTQTLVGKKVQFITSTTYRIEEACKNGGTTTFVFGSTRSLPTGIVNSQSGNGIIFYLNVDGGGTDKTSNFVITLSLGSSSRTITVSPDGTIE